MSSLIPERPLVISPSLAATIGLEESVLLQLLNDLTKLSGGEQRGGHRWYTLPRATLEEQLPFWDCAELQRVCNSLCDKGIILVESSPLSQCGQLLFAMNEPCREGAIEPGLAVAQPHLQRTPQPIRPPQQQRPQQPSPPQLDTGRSGASLLAENWQPDEDLLQLLALNHGIPREFALRQLEDFVLYWRERRQVSHAWASKFRQHVLKEWRFQQSRDAAAQPSVAGPSITEQPPDLDSAWQPSPDALEILHRAGVNAEFIEDAIPEFVLYWRERGESSNTWNSKFIAHIRRQWARYSSALKADYEPQEIPANWQPSEDVYDILRMANIDLDFARQLIPEFVLFWRDTKQIQRSWNSKFLQHAKYQWASRNHYSGQLYNAQGLSHAGQQGSHSAAHSTASGELRNSPFKQLTDRSWAEGIVDGL